MTRVDLVMSSFRWRTEVEARKLGRAETHTFRCGKDVLAVVRKHRSGGWFWYTAPEHLPHRSTADSPVKDLGAAMSAVKDYVRAALDAGSSEEGRS